MSRGGVTSAINARIAAGDFGGGRTFPVGTPVVIVSNHGNLEVLGLGNIPGVCDLFNRGTEEPNGGWERGRYGPWLNELEMVEIDLPGPAVVNDYWVQEGEAIMRYQHTPETNPVQGLKFPEGFEYPLEVRFEYYITGSPFANDYTNFNLYFGPQYYWDVDAWIVAFSTYIQGTSEVFYSLNSSDDGGYSFPIDTSVDFSVSQTILQTKDPRWVVVRIDETGLYMKSWRSDEDEPEDWGLFAPWTGTVPDPAVFRFIYLENQSFTFPILSGDQPQFHLKTFCVNENPR